jgi:DinB superfamily
MNPTIQQMHHNLASSLRGLTVQQTQLHPLADQQKWSIQQIADHLLLTYASTAAAFENRIAKGTPTRSRPTPPQRLRSFVVLQLGYMPNGRSAPEAVRPMQTPPLSGEELTALAVARLLHMASLLDEAEPLFGTSRSVTHGILGPLCARDWRRFHLVHTTHHIRQILTIRRNHRI